MAEIVLEGHQLSKAFGKDAARTLVLNNVSVQFEAGQIALLMGPSGSGKSTLLAVLSGLLRPDHGTVLALQKELWSMSEAERQRWRLESVGFVFQQHNLLPNLTIRQQLEMLLKMGSTLSPTRIRSRVMETLELFGIGSRADLRPLALSGGEKQRASIARALLKIPKLCFADEPTSALDWHSGKTVIDCLRNYAHTNNTTTVLVTHDRRLLPYADVVYYLEDGQISTTPDEPVLADHDAH